MLSGRSVARTKVGCIVGVDSIGDRGNVLLCRKFIKHLEKFVFAEVAPVACVGAVRGVVQFVRFDEFVTNGELLQKGIKLIAIVSGVTRRNCCNRECAIAENFVCGPCEISGVRAARKRDDERRDLRKIREELRLLFRGGKGRRLARMNLDDAAHQKSITQKAPVI